MNVLDSSGWLEYFLEAENASIFEPIVHDVGSLIVPSVVIYEVTRVLRRAVTPSLVAEAFAAMTIAEVVDLDADTAAFASYLGASHRLAMADAIIYATALSRQAELWTQDIDLGKIEGVHYVAKRR